MAVNDMPSAHLMAGMMRLHSVAASSLVALGRVDWPPMSMMSAPSATACLAASTASPTVEICSMCRHRCQAVRPFLMKGLFREVTVCMKDMRESKEITGACKRHLLLCQKMARSLCMLSERPL